MFQVLLLMASAISMEMTDGSENKSRASHMRVAEITEMIHVSIVAVLQSHILLFCFLPSIFYLLQVACLLHDDVLDDADTRRGVSSLNLIMGNKVFACAIC